MPTTFPTRRTPQTFQRSKLNWAEVDSGEHARLHALYRDLIALRRTEADLADPWLDHLVRRLRRRAALDHDAPRRAGDRLQSWHRGGSCAGHRELVLAWDSPGIGAGSTVLEGHSFAILRASR